MQRAIKGVISYVMMYRDGYTRCGWDDPCTLRCLAVTTDHYTTSSDSVIYGLLTRFLRPALLSLIFCTTAIKLPDFTLGNIECELFAELCDSLFPVDVPFFLLE